METLTKQVETFTERHPFLGPISWIASLQFFIIQYVVAAGWPVAYSWFNNAISDLGNTVCSDYSQRYVCSPGHGLMNFSFVFLGLTMMLGSLLIYEGFKKSYWSLLGFTCMGLAGLGSILVGVFPENVSPGFHLAGAILPFLIGNLGMVVLGLVLDLPRWLRYYSVASGVVGLTAAWLFAMQMYAGLGLGGMERLAIYPQTTWLIVFGVYISSTRVKRLE